MTWAHLKFVVWYLIATSAKHSAAFDFSQDNLIVQFDPYVSWRDKGVPGAYNEKNLGFLATHFSTKFRKMIHGGQIATTEFLSGNSIHLIPSAVAHLNLQRRQEKKPTLDVMLRVNLQDSEGIPDILSRFDLGLELADKANSIFSGTVQTILLLATASKTEREHEILAYCRNKTATSSNSYKLALSRNFWNCLSGDSVVIEQLKPSLEFVDIVVIANYPDDEILRAGSQAFLTKYVPEFKSCKARLQRLIPHVDVYFDTEWPDTNDQGVQNLGDFVLFWEKLNEFATKTNTTLILREAFDLPYTNTIPKRHKGWWRLVENSSYTSAADYVFEDKLQLLTLERKEKAKKGNEADKDKPESTGLDTPSIVGIVVVSCLLLLGVIGLIMFAVFRLMNRRMQQIIDRLSDAELREFFHGGEVPPGGNLEDPNYTFLARAYDMNLEIPMDSTEIETNMLGAGAFGAVFRAIVFKNQERIPTAVKMSKGSHSVDTIRGLLSEIKIMSYVGRHENLVSIVGANTSNLQKGNSVYIFLELCDLGSLDKYLEGMFASLKGSSSDKGYTNLLTPESDIGIEDATEMTVKPSLPPKQASDLLRWSAEIANGLEFLASKNVVHADVATRNVLLTANKTAKISDFGLSRRLYEYTNYVKTKQEPLPWRWMSPESLRRLVFNEKTDVWSFGVTLWEIFSLGETPYQGLAWDVDFSSVLENGLRLKKPDFDDQNIYEVMVTCWHYDPIRRPSFAGLKAELYGRFSQRYVNLPN